LTHTVLQRENIFKFVRSGYGYVTNGIFDSIKRKHYILSVFQEVSFVTRQEED